MEHLLEPPRAGDSPPARAPFRRDLREVLDSWRDKRSLRACTRGERSLSWRLEGAAPKSRPFVVGASCGLLIYFDGRLERLLPGPIYGICRDLERYYVLQRLRRSSRILTFTLTWDDGGPHVRDLSILTDGLSVGIHQIDFIANQLFACDTYNNRILVLQSSGRVVQALYPRGALCGSNIASVNYKHYNSIYCDFRMVYLVAHNDSVKAGRSSEIHRFDFNDCWYPAGTIRAAGWGAHNFMIHEQRRIWCDSLNGVVVIEGAEAYRTDGMLTRGLAGDSDGLVVGLSAVKFGAARLTANGAIAFLDIEGNETGRLHIESSGGISEVRLLSDDAGLSNSHLPAPARTVLGGAVGT